MALLGTLGNVMNHLARHAKGLRGGCHVTDRPTSGRMSSLRISPGCTGGNAFFLSISSPLMIILKINIVRIFTRPAERDPVVSSDAH